MKSSFPAEFQTLLRTKPIQRIISHMLFEKESSAPFHPILLLRNRAIWAVALNLRTEVVFIGDHEA